MMRFLGAKVILTPRAPRAWACIARPRSSPRPTVGSSPGSSRPGQRRHPREHDGARDRSPISRASGSTTGSPATAPAARSRASGACCARSGRRRRSFSASRANAQLLGSGVRAGARRRARRRPPATPPSSRTRSRAGHPDFIPYVLQEAVDKHYYDELVPVAGPEGMEWSRQARGRRRASSPASRAGRRVAVADAGRRERRRRARSSCCMLPDTGERYLSTPLFEPYGADMNDEEQAISRSTPGYQLG